MEKRALLALILSVLVLLFWEYYFTPYQPQQPSKESKSVESTDQKKLPEKPSLDNFPPGDTTSIRPFTEAAPKMEKWIVKTPIYEAEIVDRGARISSIKLLRYRAFLGKDAPPMELISVQPLGYFPGSVDLLKNQKLYLATHSYKGPSEREIILKDGEERSVKFYALVGEKVLIEKTYLWRSNTYMADMEVRVKNISSEPIEDRIGLSFYFMPYQKDEPSYNISQLAYYGNKSFNALDMKELKKEMKTVSAPVDWIGYQNNYFLQALIPETDEKYQIVGRIVDDKDSVVQLVYLSESFNLKPQEDKVWKFKFYTGPKEMSELKKSGYKLVASIDYGWVGFLAKPLLYLLKWLYSFTHNYGVAIIILTIVVKLVCWPLTDKSYQSMKKMKQIQPLINQIREKYKDDREKLNQELMNLYRTYKVNPMGGCLPILLQIPIFFALYRMLYSAVELRHQPFCLWITDLTAPDRLNIGFSIPYLGGLPVLTLLMGATMFIQQKMSPSPGDPRQEKIMLLMPIVFTVLFINFPSGLVLYWFVNNILSIAQQYWIERSSKE
ncbi:MAG: membrane protein insertase YidC [Syntrophobacterales bacterium]|nr:membrane protein insertase YidC [Syntrophobacterales bacterium]